MREACRKKGERIKISIIFRVLQIKQIKGAYNMKRIEIELGID